MITLAHARMMARYNAWQNAAHLEACAALSDAERWTERGAFFGSIARTLNHILGDDQTWLARLRRDEAGAAARVARFPYADAPRDWETFVRARRAVDSEITDFMDALGAGDLDAEIPWLRGSERLTTPAGFMVAHLFNHQTHHRGQVHAMLGQLGVAPPVTDLMVLPGGPARPMERGD
ncbi:MAG: DinB family protein [Pseudomonadota bacterium]